VGHRPDLSSEIIRRDGEQSRLLVLLHGYGEPVDELTDRLDRIDPDARYLAVAPAAPFERKGRAIWHRAIGAGQVAEDQFHASLAAIDAHLGELEAETGLAAADAVVGGFSQGGGLALGLLLWADTLHRPAAGFGICSFPPHITNFRISRAAAAGRPYLLSSARSDHFAPIEASRSGAATLVDVGIDLTYREAEGDHVMTDQAADAIGAWMAAIERGERWEDRRDLLADVEPRLGYLQEMWEFVDAPTS
jgi:phospholipase/carboxylesterase